MCDVEAREEGNYERGNQEDTVLNSRVLPFEVVGFESITVCLKLRFCTCKLKITSSLFKYSMSNWKTNKI